MTHPLSCSRQREASFEVHILEMLQGTPKYTCTYAPKMTMSWDLDPCVGVGARKMVGASYHIYVIVSYYVLTRIKILLICRTQTKHMKSTPPLMTGHSFIDKTILVRVLHLVINSLRKVCKVNLKCSGKGNGCVKKYIFL